MAGSSKKSVLQCGREEEQPSDANTMPHLAHVRGGLQNLNVTVTLQEDCGDGSSKASNDGNASPSLLILNSKNENIPNNDTGNQFEWHIEGVDGLGGDDNIFHMNAFYYLLKMWYCNNEYTSILLFQEQTMMSN